MRNKDKSLEYYKRKKICIQQIDNLNVESLKKIFIDHAKLKLWFIYKDLIDVCKDCEYRHMCVDSRLPNQ
jgi:hypothetical protein